MNFIEELKENQVIIAITSPSGVTKGFRPNSKYTATEHGIHKFKIARKNATSTNGIVSDIYIVKDENLSSYEPYKENRKDILLPFGIKSLPSGICDVLKNNILEKNILETVLNGDGNWISYNRDLEKTISFYLVATNIKPAWNPWDNILCDKFKCGDVWNDDTECIAIDNNLKVIIRINKSKLETQDVAGFKKWLRLNPTTIYCALSKPINYDVENVNLKTYFWKTHVNIEDFIQSKLKFKAPVDIPAAFSNQKNKIQEQRDLIDALEYENIKLKNDLVDTAKALNDNDTKIIKQNLDMDFRLMEIEFTLDTPLAFNFSNNNKTGGDIKVVRTLYEMMKIVILSGDYNKDDYMYKAKVYHDRGRMTQEEYDELVALMIADEVLNK